MDPLSLTASLIAVGQAAATALQIAQTLCDLVRAIKSAPEEIESLTLDLRVFGCLVEIGQGCLERHCKKTPQSPVLRYIESRNVLEQLGVQSERTTSRLLRLREKTGDIYESSSQFLTRLKWLFQKGDIKAMKPDMESLKLSLQLVMAAVQLENLEQSGEKELEEEIKSLKRQIQMHSETIVFLQESCQRQKLEVGDSVQVFDPLDINAQNAILGLGESMVERGTVPQTGSSRHNHIAQSFSNPHHGRSKDDLLHDIKQIEGNVKAYIGRRDNAVKEAEQHKRTRKELEEKLFSRKLERKYVKLARPRLVCGAIACSKEFKTAGGSMSTTYPSCYDDFRDEHEVRGGLLSCPPFNNEGVCNNCGHPSIVHAVVNSEIQDESVAVMDADVRALLDKTIFDIVAQEGHISVWNSQIATFRAKLVQLQQALDLIEMARSGDISS